MMKAKEKTPEEMTPRERVQYATSLLKDAVLEYLASQPKGARSKIVREELGFDDKDLLAGVRNLLIAEGSVEKEKHKLIVLTAKTEDDQAKS